MAGREIPPELWSYVEYRSSRNAAPTVWELREATWSYGSDDTFQLSIRGAGDRFQVVDAGGPHRIRLDRQLLEPGVPVPLRAGGVIETDYYDQSFVFHGTTQPEVAARGGWLPKTRTGHIEITASEDDSLPGQVVRIRRTPFRIGVAWMCDLRPACRGATPISRIHTLVHAEADGSWSVEDHGTANGTRLNGHLIGRVSGRREPLAVGDVVDVGGHCDDSGRLTRHTQFVFRGE